MSNEQESKLHKPGIGRILVSRITGAELLDTFQQLVAQCELEGTAGIGIVNEFVEEGDKFEVGSYVPSVHIVVQKVIQEQPDGTPDDS